MCSLKKGVPKILRNREKNPAKYMLLVIRKIKFSHIFLPLRWNYSIIYEIAYTFLASRRLRWVTKGVFYTNSTRNRRKLFFGWTADPSAERLLQYREYLR